jgi:thioredoxin:protein disulfide reductase
MNRLSVPSASGTLLVAMLASATVVHAMSADALLEPEQAFRFSVQETGSSTIQVQYEIAEGYYLYRQNSSLPLSLRT